MSESPSKTSPDILVNGEQQDNPPTVEEYLDDDFLEDNVAADKEKQAKMQSFFQQVGNQIRSQVGGRAPKSSILELVQKLKDRETVIAQENNDPKGEDVKGEEEKQAGVMIDECKDGIEVKQELCAIFEEKLEASKKVLQAEFEVQMLQVREEMQAYTDQALKDLEHKMQSLQPHNLKETRSQEQQDGKTPDKKQKLKAAPSLASRRGRVLTRTMTTIIPKTCAPVILGPRAKSETLSSTKGESLRFLPRDPALSSVGNKPDQSRRPLPPARPPLHQRKKQTQAKATAGK